MPRYRVFLGAPKFDENVPRSTDVTHESWQTIDSTSSRPPSNDPWFEAASRRISKLYENVIFHDDGEDYDGDERNFTVEQSHASERTTFITWDPTCYDRTDLSFILNRSEGTFLRPSASVSKHQAETQETQETGSYDYSDASSIARFPAFHFDLHILTSLSSLKERTGLQISLEHSFDLNQNVSAHAKLNLLAAVLEVEGPDSIRIKKGPDAGKEVSILKLIIADEDGTVCKLVAWRETAERWGGSYTAEDGVKRGDVVLFYNVKLSPSKGSSDGLTLAASPMLSSSLQICFRTMPLGSDTRYRPDLRLGFSDAAVRKVAAVVAWFENMAGLPNSEQLSEFPGDRLGSALLVMFRDRPRFLYENDVNFEPTITLRTWPVDGLGAKTQNALAAAQLHSTQQNRCAASWRISQELWEG